MGDIKAIREPCDANYDLVVREGWDAMAKANHKRNIYGMGSKSLCVVTSDAYASDSMSGAHRQAAMW